MTSDRFRTANLYINTHHNSTLHKNRMLARIGLIFVVLLLGACASLTPFESVKVDLVGLQPLPSENNEARFRVTLKLLNPNNRALNLDGVSVNLGLNGYDVLSGVTNQPLNLPALGEARLPVDISLSLFASLGLLQSLLSKPASESLQYQMDGKLHTSEMWLPNLSFARKGEIKLGQP